MKLELMYDNPDPTYYGDDEEPPYAYSEGVFNTYKELLEDVDAHWDYRAFYRLFIAFCDNDCPTKEERRCLANLNEKFKNDLAKIEHRKKLIEEIEGKWLALKLRYYNDPDVPPKFINVYANYYLLNRDADINLAPGVQGGLYIDFPDGYVPSESDKEALEYLNEKFKNRNNIN